MPTLYRGRVEIKCNKEICIEDKARENVSVVCLNCKEVATTVVDLDQKPLGAIKPKVTETEAQKPINKQKKA